MKILRNFSIFYGELPGEDKNPLDSQISWDFATEIVDFFKKYVFQMLEKNYLSRSKVRVRIKSVLTRSQKQHRPHDTHQVHELACPAVAHAELDA